MPKKPTLLQISKTLKPKRSGARDWFASLTPAQRKEFDEWLADWLVTPEHQRISKKQAIELITQELKPITQHTFDKYITGGR